MKIATAKRMINLNSPDITDAFIAEVSDLTLEEVEKLRSSLIVDTE